MGEAQRILAAWFTDCLHSIVDVVGSDDAVRICSRHFENSGHAGVLVGLKYLGLEGKDEVDIIRTFSHVHQGLGHETGLILAGNGNARITFTRCPFDSGALEICRLFCFHGGRGAVRGLLPGRDLTIIATRYDGDEECAKQIFPMGEESRVWAVEMEVLPPNPPLPEVYADYLTRAYLGEFFLIMVRSSMESPRRHELFQGMAMAMRTRGLQEGLALKGDSKERIAHLMGVIGMRAILAPEGITVTECPFSQAPAEACTLVESFWKGVAASCGSEAEYRHAVTRGDPQCLLCFGKDRPRL